MSKVSLIAALSENRVIGKDNKLPWHISEDLKRFKEVTSGHPVIMGRKTFQSISRPLPGRLNIVITRDPNWKMDGVSVAHSLGEALELGKKENSGEVFIIGGGQIFAEAISNADKLYLTVIHTEIDGDAFFPDYSAFNKEVFRQEGESEGYKYTFLELEKFNP